MDVRALQGRTLPEVDAALKSMLADGVAPNLAIVFASVAHNLTALGAMLASAGMDVFGASSSGEILAAEFEQIIYEQSIVALLINVDRAAYCLRLFDAHDQPLSRVGQEVGLWAKETFAQPALLVMMSGVWPDGEQLVKGFMQATDTAIPLYGGKAGDDGHLKDTFVFSNNGLSDFGVLALSVDQSRITVQGQAASGWHAVGIERTITESDGMVVRTIDNVPALDLYRDYLGVANDTEITFLEWPLQILRDGYSVLRTPMWPAPQPGALQFAGIVAGGSQVRFSTSPGIEIIDEALAEMRKLHEQIKAAKALVLFSCLCRHLALGPLAEDEVQPMQQLWGAPLVGFYSYGEIGPNIAGVCDFHNSTCVLVALGER
jgi:hypothetical protein